MAPKGKKKNPPIMSHEFVIQNHADIVAVIAMVFMLGLMVEFLHPLASSFIALSHNVTVADSRGQETYFFRPGPKDMLAVFFYTLIMILAHAVIQEFILDKFNKKLHLSKIKFAKFNESGQLVAFYAFSFIFAGNLLWNTASADNGLVKLISGFWTGYPDSHMAMEWMVKLFYILQISYWVHIFPELYLTKTKKEDMPTKILYAVLYLVVIIYGYAMHYQKVMLVLLAMHYLVEGVFHLARVLYFLDKQQIAQGGFKLWSMLFVAVRLGTVAISVLTFWIGFGKVHAENPSLATNMLSRATALGAVVTLQAWMSWNFIRFQMRRKKDGTEEVVLKKAAKASNGSAAKSSKKKQ